MGKLQPLQDYSVLGYVVVLFSVILDAENSSNAQFYV